MLPGPIVDFLILKESRYRQTATVVSARTATVLLPKSPLSFCKELGVRKEPALANHVNCFLTAVGLYVSHDAMQVILYRIFRYI
jgi:hypothetical protein